MRVWFNRNFASISRALALIQAADTEGRFELVYSHPDSNVAAAQLAHKFHVEPALHDEGAYLDWCLEFCREHRIDVFVPWRAATAIAGLHERFAAVGTRVMSVASSENLALINDKAKFYAATELASAPVPESLAFDTVAGFDQAYRDLRGRHATLCVKPARGIYGQGFAVVDEHLSCAELLLGGAMYRVGLDDLRRGFEKMGHFRSMLLMEYLEGREYSVDCVGDQGKLRCAVPRRKSSGHRKGQVIEMRAEILEAVEQLSAMYGLNGMYNVQFRESAGRVRLLEINPRLSGGIGISCAAGTNLPWLALSGFVDHFERVQASPVRDGARIVEQTIYQVTE